MWPDPDLAGKRPWWKIIISTAALTALACCGRDLGLPDARNDLKAMQTSRIHIGQHVFEVWLALEPEQRSLGLMQVTAEELAPIAAGAGEGQPVHRGMLFVFPREQPLSFWMYNTIVGLDIAYIDSGGQIVRICSMAPLETRSYPSVEPARFALEVPAGLFAELGIARGDQVEIPESVLKGAR